MPSSSYPVEHKESSSEQPGSSYYEYHSSSSSTGGPMPLWVIFVFVLFIIAAFVGMYMNYKMFQADPKRYMEMSVLGDAINKI
jgi:hypothetical protein